VQRVALGVEVPGQRGVGERVRLLALAHQAAEDPLAKLVQLVGGEGRALEDLEQKVADPRQPLGQALG
jgi:hypothetical protein